jgi:hypothetical protein
MSRGPSSIDWERHPSFGLVSISRVQSGGGRHLFESPFGHQHFITLSIKRARRQRTDLHDDFLMADEELVEVSMSEVQFATMVTSLNMGQGTPCTISRFDGRLVDEPPAPITKKTFEKEGKEHFTDLVKMAKELEGLVNMKPADVKAPEREKIRILALHLLQGLTCNMEFFQKQFQQTMDKVVGVAKAEIQAHIAAVVQGAGLKALVDGKAPFRLEMAEDRGQDMSHPDSCGK